MKCIQDIETGEVVRVRDEIAAKRVNEGTHKYANKELWKKTGRRMG